MTKPTYRAEASRKLVITLTLAVLAAAAFWIVRLSSSDDIDATGPYTIYCPTCGKQEAAELKWEGRKFLCPECNQYTASFEDPSTKPPGGMEVSP